MIIETFLDSTIELYQVFGSGESTMPVCLPEFDTNTRTSIGWRFRVLTLVQGSHPALFESPTLYEEQDWAMCAAKIHAIQAKVENTEDVPAMAILWDEQFTILAQNDRAFALLGTTPQESAVNLFEPGARRLIKDSLSKMPPASAKSGVFPVHWVSPSGEEMQASLSATQFYLSDTLICSLERLVDSCRCFCAVEAFDISP